MVFAFMTNLFFESKPIWPTKWFGYLVEVKSSRNQEHMSNWIITLTIWRNGYEHHIQGYGVNFTFKKIKLWEDS
jgi:hypothetical protein